MQSDDECEAKHSNGIRQRRGQLGHKRLKGITVPRTVDGSMQPQDHFNFVQGRRTQAGYLVGAHSMNVTIEG